MTITKILVANRSEIAIRVFRAANELGLKTVAVFAEEDKLALHRFKSDEAYQIGKGLGPIEAYLSVPEVIRVAREAHVDAIHPGYGLLSENPDLAEACAEAGIAFIGPPADIMRRLGDKVSARHIAVSAGVPVMPASDPLPDDMQAARKIAADIGYPLMLKAAWGGGGRGMRVIRDQAALVRDVGAAKREARAAFGRDEVYLEKLVERARHVEVQILADSHGNVVHLFERDCTVQRRHQKVVERAPASYLNDGQRRQLADYAMAIARGANYVSAGTVEFLQDAGTGAFYFIEVNPRIQVEHTVTEEVTGIDIVKAQIHIAEGETIGTPQSGVPPQEQIRLNGHALQCRITTEDPEQNFIPDYGRITAYRGATGFGIRLDGGTAYSGAVITRFYDPLLEKVTAWAPSPEEAIARMDRALREFRIRGVATNLAFLENVVGHPSFRDASYTTGFIDETPELFEAVGRRDRATKLLTYIADVTVNGHPDTRDRVRPEKDALDVPPPRFEPTKPHLDQRSATSQEGAPPLPGGERAASLRERSELGERGEGAETSSDRATLPHPDRPAAAARSDLSPPNSGIPELGFQDGQNRKHSILTGRGDGASSGQGVGDVWPPPGAKQRLDRDGPEAFAHWMRGEKRALVTDTTMRDAHQSLLATRMRSHDLTRIAPAYAAALPQLLSLECWGGATFDVAMRFLAEDPWERLADIREKVPNILLQMLLRGSNAVGYANYPDNVVRFFVRQAADAGVDLFRVFDCLNWVENMRVSMDAVREAGKLCEGAMCYTGDLFDPDRAKYDLKYYVNLAHELEAAGAHIIGIKDMGGLCKPAAAKKLVETLRQETDLPIHFHTHDTSGVSAASVLAAVEAGVDAFDAAIDSMSGLTSQPCLGSLVEALADTERDTGLDPLAIRQIAFYFEAVRARYRAFESDLRFGASEVYLHEMPGGQFTNLKEQARALGLEARWHEVARAYADVNMLFGDIVKVTPSSKVVGDLALMMVASDLTVDDIADPKKEIAFPESVVQMMRGDLGQPPGGWPKELQKKVLKGAAPITVRPGSLIPPADLDGERAAAAEKTGSAVDDRGLASYLMYPKVYVDYAKAADTYGPVSVLPTQVFFYGLPVGEEILIDLERGKTLVVRTQAIGETDGEGFARVFFELNGQPRMAKVPDRRHGASGREARRKAEEGNPAHVAAPMPGVVSTLAVKPGQAVKSGDVLLSIEAMKMETALHAERNGTVAEVLVSAGSTIDAKDLLVVFGE